MLKVRLKCLDINILCTSLQKYYSIASMGLQPLTECSHKMWLLHTSDNSFLDIFKDLRAQWFEMMFTIPTRECQW